MNRCQISSHIIDRLEASRLSIQSQWMDPEGTTTRHFVVDGLLPDEIARQIHDDFPADGSGFRQQASLREHKKTSADLTGFTPLLVETSYAFQDPAVVEIIADLTGMKTIEPDPLFYAGGLSMMFHGDFLNPHIDNSHDAKRDRYRRLNILYYVNPAWDLECGGNFELWDEHRTVPKTIVSGFNRMVVMETTSRSFHSVSKVHASQPRCCISNYYFSRESPSGDDYFHVTSFFGRPDQPVRRVIGYVDNLARSLVARVLGGGRGRNAVNRRMP